MQLVALQQQFVLILTQIQDTKGDVLPKSQQFITSFTSVRTGSIHALTELFQRLSGAVPTPPAAPNPKFEPCNYRLKQGPIGSRLECPACGWQQSPVLSPMDRRISGLNFRCWGERLGQGEWHADADVILNSHWKGSKDRYGCRSCLSATQFDIAGLEAHFKRHYEHDLRLVYPTILHRNFLLGI